MARSIHRTRRDLTEVEERDYADAERRDRELQAIAEQLEKKRRIKGQVRSERRTDEGLWTPVALEAIPVRVRDESDFVHYPAGVEDIREVMRRLPVGVLDGIRSIDLCLGREDQADTADDWPDDKADPFVGRVGVKLSTEVFSGRTLGRYHFRTAGLRLYAYVYDAAMPDRALKELYLRLQMLSTFVHEVAHHYDFTMRVSRGRWLADDREKLEVYAENRQHDWLQRTVVPYLEAAYPAECQAFAAWTEHHGGISLPLGVLAGDPRSSVESNAIRMFFSVGGAFESLMEAVSEVQDLTATRLRFARELHYGENYAEALAIIRRFLEETPDEPEALTLQADIAVHQEEYDVERALCKRVLGGNESYVEAWEVLADVYWGQRSWADLHHAATRALALNDTDKWARLRALRHRARACLELGDMVGLDADVDEIRNLGRPRDQCEAAALWAIMLLRTGRTEEALEMAVGALEEFAELRFRRSRSGLAAVRFDAAHQLGRPSEAGELTQDDMEYLRCQGYEAWMDRLAQVGG